MWVLICEVTILGLTLRVKGLLVDLECQASYDPIKRWISLAKTSSADIETGLHRLQRPTTLQPNPVYTTESSCFNAPPLRYDRRAACEVSGFVSAA